WSSFARMAATRCGSVPDARTGFAAVVALADLAGFTFFCSRFCADFFFFNFGGIGAKTIAWTKERRAACGKLFRGDCADFSLLQRVRRRFFSGEESKTPDRSQIPPHLLATQEFLHLRGR